MRHLGRASIGLIAATGFLAWVGAAEAAFPVAQNGEITYHRYDNVQFDVFRMGPTGAGQLDLTNTDGYEVSPSFSPNGQKIAFVRFVGLHNDDIFSMNADGTGQVDLTNTPDLAEASPVFSPDGKRIAYSTDDEEPQPVDIHLMKADGTGQVDLTNTATLIEKDPDFSPDGKRIAFSGCEGPRCDIYLIAPDGSGLTNLTKTPAGTYDGNPSFSPDGKRVFFQSTVGGRSEIGVVNADGSGLANLTSSTIDEIAPSVSPDGRLIAYNAIDPASPSDIFTVDAATGGSPADLTNTASPFREESPNWESIYTCAGKRATIVGSDSGEKLKGTKKADVIVGNGGKDKIKGKGGNDRICGGAGKDKLSAGKGRDRCIGGPGKDSGKACEKGKL